MTIERDFIKWCAENGIASVPSSLVAYMDIRGWLNVDTIANDIRPLREPMEIAETEPEVST